MAINPSRLANEIAKMLSDYSQEVVDKVDISSERVGKEAVKRLKQTSPKDTGSYSKSWRVKTFDSVRQPKRRIVHSPTSYHLTHLLEHGHAKSGGGRVEAKPHIGPAEEQVIQQFTKEVEEAIRNG